MRSLTDFAGFRASATQAATARSRRRSSAAEDADIRPRISSRPMLSSRSAPIRLRQSSSQGKRDMPRRSHREPRIRSTPIRIPRCIQRARSRPALSSGGRPVQFGTPVCRTRRAFAASWPNTICRRSPANTPGHRGINAPASIKPGRKNPEAVGRRGTLIVAKARDRHTGLPLLGEGLDRFHFLERRRKHLLGLARPAAPPCSAPCLSPRRPRSWLACPLRNNGRSFTSIDAGLIEFYIHVFAHPWRRSEPRRPAACP